MAIGSRSSQVYALGLMACDRGGRRGACQMLSAEQWARLDPSNAAPWMKVLSEASNRRDAAALDEAVFQIARASSYNESSTLPLKQVMARLPADTSLYERFTVMASLFIATHSVSQAFTTLPAQQVLSRYCDAQAVLDANRRQACGAVAETLVERSPTLTDFRFGVALAERGGWPVERLHALREEGDAAVQASIENAGKPGDLGCGFLAREQARMAEMARAGEWPVLSRRVKASPDGVAELAKRFRDAKARAQSVAAASAPAVR